MRRRFLSILLTICMLASIFPTGAWAAKDLAEEIEVYSEAEHNAMAVEAYKLTVYDLDGSGTEKDPYKISTREDLETLADAVNAGNDLKGVYFKQTVDINLGGKDDPWTVIGYVKGNTPHPFNGVYDGDNFMIYGLFVGTTDEDGEPVGTQNEDAGLFGHVGINGVIRKVHVVDCIVYNKALYVGGIAGRNEGLVEYCSSNASDPDASSGVVNGSWQYAGGIVGYNFGTISYCYSNCDVYGAQKVGGITGGQNGGTVVNCYFRGYVYASDITRGYAGGIAGENDGNSTIDNCYSDCIVDGYNDRAYCGAIAGSNDTGSTVGNCFWEDSDNTGLPGIASGMGDVKNVEERTSEQFESGEVAWELSKGTNGGDWGQVLDRGEDNPDRHPHFLTQPDKEDESEVYRVTFKANNPKIDLTYFVDPGADVVLPEDTPENTKWYVKGKEFDGTNIRADMDAVAVRRFLFAGETEPIEATGTYSTEAQTLELNLDEHMGYENGGPSAVGRFEYIIAGDKDGLNAQLDIDGNILTIPPKTNVKDDGYTLTVKAHEKKPFIATLSLGPFDKEDVYLTVKVMINKATPVIVAKPTASTIDYGMNLASSTLAEDGEAQHPTTGANVEGKFEWTDGGIYPTIDKAAIVGYSVTFTPRDTNNYNTATTLVTLTVNKVDPTNIVPPTPNDITYNGNAQDLITAGSAIGGTMKYWITDDSNDNPPEDNFAFSSTIPARANAGTYIVWYKVLGDENHNDTVPKSIEITIKPYKLNIEPGPVFYNGSGVYALTLDGAGGEIVVATLTAYSKDAKTYEYATTAAEGKYTVKLSSPNYVVEQTETLTITPLPVVLQWEGPLTIEYDGQTHTVTAKVTNGIAGDTFNLVYEDNTGTAAKKYTAKVTQLGNSNYTLIGGQNVEQPWRIFERSGNLNLTANPAGTKEVPITYGDMLTLTLKISPVTDINGKVKFYINDKLINGDVSYDDYANYNNKIATITVEATSLHDFSLGANAVRADYVSGNDNNNVIDIDAITVYVNPKPITAVITGDTTSKTYDGNTAATGLGITLQTSDIEVGDEDYVTVTADGYTYNSNYVSKATTITAQNVMLNGTRSGNYKITTPVALHGNIMPKAVRLEWRGATGLVYTGTPANVNATATELVPGDVCTVEVTGGDKSNAGINYTAEAKGLDNPNYRLSEFDKTQVYSIAPATLYIPEQHVTYNGTGKFNVEVDGVTLTNDTSEKVSTKLTASSADVGNYDYAKTIGDSKYTASTDNSNYQIASGAMLIIEKADPDYTAPVGKKLKYNAMPQELTTVGMAHGGEMQYSISKDGTYSTDIPTGTKKGTYTIWYRVIGDTNHNDIAPQSVVATITLNDPNTPTVSATPVNSSKPGDPVDSTDPDDPIVSTKPNALRESPKPDDTTKKPSSTQKSNDVPETRDETNITFWIVLMLLSLSGIIITLFAKKKIK